MNKRIVHVLTGVAMTGSMMAPMSAPIWADEVAQPVEVTTIETAQQFIDSFLSMTLTDESGVVTTQLIMSADANTYGAILSSKAVFDTCPPALQQEIVNTLAASGVDYFGLVAQATAVQESLLPPQEEQPQPEQQPAEQPEETQPEQQNQETQSQEAQPEEEPVLRTLSVEEDVVEEAQPAVQEVVEEAISQPEVSAKVAQVITQQPQEETVQPQETAQTEEPQAQPEQTALATVKNVGVIQPDTAADDQDAQAFVNTYLSNANGTIYPAANTANYQRILSGVGTWNQMTTSQKAKVNAILTREVKKTYQELLKEAQAIQYQQTGTTNPYVNGRIVTGTQTNMTTTIALLVGAAIVGILAFFGLKKKKN